MGPIGLTPARPSIRSRKGLLYPHWSPSNAYSVNVNLPSTCSWSTLPRMTAERCDFSLVCLPPGEGGLIAIGGFNGSNRIDVVEFLGGEDATDWRRLAPLPLPLASRGGVYFKQRILVVGGRTKGGALTSAMLAFTPPTAGGLGQWVNLKPTLPKPGVTMHTTVCGNSLYFVSKFTFPTQILNLMLTLQFRLIFKIWLLHGRAYFLSDEDATPIVYRFSPTRQASLEEKRVSV